ncbi:MAG: hypothetical protein JNK21_08415 [Rhodospirillaceae bacterium]|nr:hypothetical protein [Rhodospirillaceae bacterium]
MSSPASASLWSDLRERAPFVIVVAVSTAWVVIVLAVLSRLGFGVLLQMPLGELSTLVAGVVAPLLGLWLVASVLEQRRELREVRRRLSEMSAQSRQSLQQAEIQSRALLEMESQLKRTLAADTRRLALQDLAAHAAILGERLGIFKNDAVDVAWARFGSGDTGAFVQPFLSYATRHPEISERMGEAVVRDALARNALSGFVRRYERLLSAISDDKLALETLEEGPLGQGYRIFKAAENKAQNQSAAA